MKGIVKFFSAKGWGIISGEDGEDYFCHHSNISSDEKFKYLETGEAITFDVQKQERPLFKRDKAVNIKLLPTTTDEVKVGQKDN